MGKSYLTNKEYQIMKILWNSEKPLLVSDILAKAENIAENSLHPMINSLIKKNYIKIVGNVKVSKTNSRLYAANISIDEYAAKQLNEIFDSANKTPDISNVLMYFSKHNKKKKNENLINELQKFIDDYKQEKF